MAISLIATTSTDAASGNPAITHGLTIASGDVLVATINANGTSNTVTDNNGATSFTSRDFIDNPDSARYYVFDRVCTGSEPATLNFTLGTSARWSVVLRQYRGVDSSIWDVAPSGTTANTGSGDLTGELASITTATNGAVALALLSDDFNPTITTFSSIDNGFGNVLTEAGQQFQTTADKTITTAGAVGITTVTCTTSATISWGGWLCALKPASATLEQEGFRFGVDDGSESTHGWEAAQDTNISTADATTKLIRLLANATGDPAAIAYKLKYAKNGGAYGTVPLVASVKTKPVIEAADCTVSGSNTAAASWAVSHPAASTGDLLTFNLAWDDSTTTTGVTPPSGANGETLVAINSTPATDGSTETRAKSWSCICTGSWTATTKTFTPSATESWSATVIRVPAGEFDATTPIGASATRGATGVADTSVLSPSLTAGASDGGGVLVWFASVDTDPLGATNPTGWTILQRQDLGAVAHGVAVRNTEVSNSESIAGGDTWAIAGDSWASVAYIIRAPTTTYDLYISASANITAGGEDTTARLTAPSGKTTSEFVTGRRWDDENGIDTTNITTDDYSEFEFPVTLRSGLTGGDYFDFRLYNSDTPFDTYTNTPRWTISSAVNLTVNDGASVTQSDAIVLTQVHSITVNDGASVTQADAVVITKQSDLIVADAFSVTQADAVTVTKSTSLTVADGASITQADTVTLTQVHSIAVADGTSTTQADAVTLTQAHNLTVTDGASVTQADEVLLNVSVTLTVAYAFSTTQADAVTVTQIHVLTVNDGTSETQADSVTLAQVHNLTANDGAIITQADAVTLSAAGSVVPSDAFSVTQADSVTLTQVHILTVEDAFSVTHADNVVVGLAGELIVADAHVTTQADTVTITKQSDLIVNNAYVTSQSDSIIITQAHTLTVASGYSSTQADAMALTQTHVLILAMCYGVTQADAVTIEIISPVAGVGELEIIKADKLRTTYAQAIETIEAQRNRTTKAQNIETIKAPKEYNTKR